MCDFGISGELVDSVAKTMDAGCKPYMAPERIDPRCVFQLFFQQFANSFFKQFMHSISLAAVTHPDIIFDLTCM